MSIRHAPRTTQAGALIAAVVAAATAEPPTVIAAKSRPLVTPTGDDTSGRGDHTNYAPKEQRSE